MPTLAQILAIESGEKNKTEKEFTELHRKAEQPKLYDGRVRNYRPADENGVEEPDELQNVQLRAKEVLEEVAKLLVGSWNLTATKDWANAGMARADVKLENGKLLIKDAPVTYLLWLEKKLNDIHTFIEKMPILDPSEVWKWSNEKNCYTTEQTWTNRTKKVMRNHQKAPATDKHPAQVEVYTEDVVIGRYQATKFSGALPAKEKEDLLQRARELKKAVLFARESANSTMVEKLNIAGPLFEYLLTPNKE